MAGEQGGESPAVISPVQQGSGAANPLVCVEGEQGILMGGEVRDWEGRRSYGLGGAEKLGIWRRSE